MEYEEKNLIAIIEENVPIDMAKYIKYVQAPQCGAIATFSGTTRDTFEGRTVLELRYEAYLPMAIRCIKSICSSARSKWNLNSIAVAHRLGPVPVGETSVLIAVSSVHRADALDACKFVIDEIKASVPIWKKEVYANGEVWKENSEFLERRLELGKGVDGESAILCSGRKCCCAMKVKVGDSDSDSGAVDSCTKGGLGECRWASSRRGGMTVLGKVTVPKPLNLPSQRLENHGLDPNVEIVPKGTLSWGSRSSSSTSNAWSSTLSPNADGTSSPSHLSGRPSSGSGTRPSTAGRNDILQG